MKRWRRRVLLLFIAAVQFTTYMLVFHAEFSAPYAIRPAPLALDTAWTILSTPAMWVMVIPGNFWHLFGWYSAWPPFLLMATINALLWGWALTALITARRPAKQASNVKK